MITDTMSTEQSTSTPTCEAEETANATTAREPHDGSIPTATGEPKDIAKAPTACEPIDESTSTATRKPDVVATSIVPPHIRKLLGEPPLLRGENAEAFNALLEQLALEANPKDFTSWLLLSEKASKLWEYSRLQRMARAVVDDEVTAAAETTFGDLKGKGEGLLTPEQVEGGADGLAIGMQCGDAADTAALTALLADWGLSVDILYARALITCQDDYLMFKKQADRTRGDIRLIDRDRERHLFALTQRPKATKTDAEDIDFQEAA